MSNITIQGPTCYEVEFTKFSDGAETCTLSKDITKYADKVFRIDVDIIDCTRDLLRIMLVHDALTSLFVRDISLFIRYMPNARADRRFEEGGAFPLKVFANIINGLNLETVMIHDPHSDVTGALINNVHIIEQEYIFKTHQYKLEQRFGKDFLLCSPDLGATKKTFDLMQSIGHVDYLQAVKIRNVATGNIVKCEVMCDDLKGQNIVIVDDISDGGASFKFLAQKLLTKNAGKIILFTTHGIYSKGLDVLEGYIDHIICHNIVGNYITQEDITEFNNKGEK